MSDMSEQTADQAAAVIRDAAADGWSYSRAYDALESLGAETLSIRAANLAADLSIRGAAVSTAPLEGRAIAPADALNQGALHALAQSIWNDDTLFLGFMDRAAAAGAHWIEVEFSRGATTFRGAPPLAAEPEAAPQAEAPDEVSHKTADEAPDTAPDSRLTRRFAALKAENRAALVTFIMAGDPTADASLKALKGLAGAGADVIELGMPFTDPMADGPAIQLAGQRALKAGQTLAKTLEMVRALRVDDADTPLVLMGYYNPIFIYGVPRFLAEAKDAGVDGLIIVDLPPEEDSELCLPAAAAGIDFIRLATPTTDARRLPTVLQNTRGFVYFVSITGVTGAAVPDPARVAQMVGALKSATDLPVAVGFGVKTPEQAAAIARAADGVVVGSAIVDLVGGGDVDAGLAFVSSLSEAVRGARVQADSASAPPADHSEVGNSPAA